MPDFTYADEEWNIAQKRLEVMAMEALLTLKRLEPGEYAFWFLTEEQKRRVCARFVDEALGRMIRRYAAEMVEP